MSRRNNLVSWVFGRQTLGHDPSDIYDIKDTMSTFEVELTLSSNIEAEIIRAREAIPDYDPIRVSAKPTITLMSITCLGRPKLKDALKRFMDANFADYKISFSSRLLLPGEFCDFNLIPNNRWVFSDFRSMLIKALEQENFEIDPPFHRGQWTPLCPLAEKVPRGKTIGKLQSPLEGTVRGIRLVQVLPTRKEILTIDSKVRAPRDIGGFDNCGNYLPRGEFWQGYSRFYT